MRNGSKVDFGFSRVVRKTVGRAKSPRAVARRWDVVVFFEFEKALL